MIFSQLTSPPPAPSRRIPIAGLLNPTRRMQASAEVVDVVPQAGVRLEEASRSMPSLGTSFLGFDLVDELGKGAFGTVFLARQPGLAGRLVALKVSADLFGEPARLAQLQHAAIMPVYSTHETEHLQAVCMPFYGRATLADLYASLRELRTLPLSGQHLISTLESKRRVASHLPDSAASEVSHEDAEGVPTELPGPLASLSRLPYIDAILLTGSRIAEGLAHAHERGIVHQDLKPANILLTDEGLPMILDFNLARTTDPHRAAVLANVGGTIPYMSPEQLKQFATRTADPARPVDGRSDIYALGLILYQLLAGAPTCYLPPGPVKAKLDDWLALRNMPPPSIRKSNPAVAPAVEAIVRKCLEADVTRRYQSAHDLLEDIERHRADLPLKHAPNPSLGERFCKWCRRNPRLASPQAVISLLALLTLGLTVASVQGAIAAHVREAQARHRKGRESVAAFAKASVTARTYLAVHAEGTDALARGIEAGTAGLERIGALEDAPWHARPEFVSLSDADKDRMNEEVATLAHLLALGQQLAGQSNQAERMEALARRSREARGNSSSTPLAGEGSEYTRAFELQAKGNYAASKKVLLPFLAMAPDRKDGQLLLARAHEMLGEFREAREAISVSIVLAPDFAPGYFSRARVALAAMDPRSALADLDMVLKLKPGSPFALIARATARRKLGQLKAARQDLDTVLSQEDAPGYVWLMRARVRQALGDSEGAAKDRAHGLKWKATDPMSLVAQGNALLSQDPRTALARYAAAEKLAPLSTEPLQNQAYVEAEVFGKPARAVAVLDRLLKSHPQHMLGLCARAVYLARCGRIEAAVRECERILELSNTPFTQYRVGCVYALCSARKPGLAPEALRLLARALTSKEAHAQILTDSDLDPLRDNPDFKLLVGYIKHLKKLQQSGT